MRLGSRFVILATAAAVVAAPASAATPAKPTVTVVKKLLKKHYLGSYPADYPAYTYEWVLVAPPKYGAPRRGTYMADGVPPNTRTTVFPVLARSRYTVCDPDGTNKRDAITARYVFFRDEFGSWTFGIKDEDRTIGGDRPAPCPIP